MRRGVRTAVLVLLLELACDRAGLQPDDAGAGGSGGSGTGGGAAGRGGASAGGSGGTGPTGGTGGGPLCARIQPGSDSFNPCGRTTSLAYSPDGQLLAAGIQEGGPTVRLWRIADGAHVANIDGIGAVTYQVAFSPDGRLLATAGASDGPPAGQGQPQPFVVNLWDVAAGTLVRTIPADCGPHASAASFSPDGTLLVTAGAWNLVEIWRVVDGARVTAISYPTGVHNARFSPDGSQVIVGGVDQRATVWNVADGKLALTLSGTADERADAAFSPDGREIATTGLGFTVKLWDAAGSLRQTLAGHGASISHVLWVNQNQLVSNDGQGTVIVWQRPSGGPMAPADIWATGGQSLGIAVSPDQRFLAAGGADAVTGVEGFYFIPLQ